MLARTEKSSLSARRSPGTMHVPAIVWICTRCDKPRRVLDDMAQLCSSRLPSVSERMPMLVPCSAAAGCPCSAAAMRGAECDLGLSGKWLWTGLYSGAAGADGVGAGVLVMVLLLLVLLSSTRNQQFWFAQSTCEQGSVLTASGLHDCDPSHDLTSP